MLQRRFLGSLNGAVLGNPQDAAHHHFDANCEQVLFFWFWYFGIALGDDDEYVVAVHCRFHGLDGPVAPEHSYETVPLQVGLWSLSLA